MAIFWTMLLLTRVAGLVTGLGTEAVVVGARVGHRGSDASLGLASGITVAASVFGLSVPGTGRWSLWPVTVGVVVGGFGPLG